MWTQPKCMLVEEWIKKLSHTHTHTHTHIMEYYLALKMKGILLLATTWMSLDDIKLTEKKRQREKEK